MPPQWVSMLWKTWVASLATMLAPFLLLCFSLATGRCCFAAIHAVLFTLNVCLAYVRWFVFIPQWPGRRL